MQIIKVSMQMYANNMLNNSKKKIKFHEGGEAHTSEISNNIM